VVGGFDFTESKFNRSLQGWRQAGSTLKPFLYAAAIERGFLTPASILDDTPVQLDTASGLYVPQNYDRAFKGPVSVRTALAGSLNVPAVRTLLLEGVESFRDRLSDAGYRGLTEDGDYYGFSLALGSAEVTLLEQGQRLSHAREWRPLVARPCLRDSSQTAHPERSRGTQGGGACLDFARHGRGFFGPGWAIKH